MPVACLAELLKDREPSRRVSEWQAVCTRLPESPLAHARLAAAYQESGDREGVATAYAEAARFNAEHARPAARACVAWAVLRLRPGLHHVRLLLVEALCKSGDYTAAHDEAARCTGAGVALPPDLARVLAAGQPVDPE